MSKDPAFLFYDGDAARDVSHMSRLERGCYFDLIQAQKKFDGFTLDQARKILGKDFDECWSAIELVLTKIGNSFHILWVKESIDKRKEHSVHQSENSKKRWENKDNKSGLPLQCDGIATAIPLENANANAIENAIEEVNASGNAKRGDNGGKNTPIPIGHQTSGYAPPRHIVTWGAEKVWLLYRNVRRRAGKPIDEATEDTLVMQLMNMPESDRIPSITQSAQNGWFYLQAPIRARTSSGPPGKRYGRQEVDDEDLKQSAARFVERTKREGTYK